MVLDDPERQNHEREEPSRHEWLIEIARRAAAMYVGADEIAAIFGRLRRDRGTRLARDWRQPKLTVAPLRRARWCAAAREEKGCPRHADGTLFTDFSSARDELPALVVPSVAGVLLDVRPVGSRRACDVETLATVLCDDFVVAVAH